jgi:hypothetical protein
MDRSLSPVRVVSLLPLHQQLNQRRKSHRRKSRARLQGAEKAAEALLGDDLAGELHVGPDRLSGLGRNLRIRFGLSTDKERNLQLLKERGWFERANLAPGRAGSDHISFAVKKNEMNQELGFENGFRPSFWSRGQNRL